MTDLAQQIMDMTLGSVNIALVIVLMGIGVVLKYAFTKLNNNTIPLIMMVLGIVLSIGLNIPFKPQDMLLTYCVQGIASGFCAVIVHSKAKEIYRDFIDFGNTTENNESDK